MSRIIDEFMILENDINKDYLHEYHPETKQINFKELSTLSNVTRNKKGIKSNKLDRDTWQKIEREEEQKWMKKVDYYGEQLSLFLNS